MKNLIPAVIAMVVGLLTLLGYFFTGEISLGFRLILTNWAVILGALAVILGLINVVIVHARRIDTAAAGWVYSLLTATAAILTIGIGAYEGFTQGGGSALYGESVTHMLFEGVVLASQAALASLVMFFLVVAAVRMMKNKPSRWTVGFLVVVVIVLIGWLPFGVMLPANWLRDWLISVPAAAGGRGILLGVALGTTLIALRVLTGVERPYKN